MHYCCAYINDKPFLRFTTQIILLKQIFFQNFIINCIFYNFFPNLEWSLPKFESYNQNYGSYNQLFLCI